MVTGFTKSKASTLAKIAALPRYRHPMDLLNEPHLPYDLQIKQMKGELLQKNGNYISEGHFKLCQNSAQLRQQYKKGTIEQRSIIAMNHFKLWNKYLRSWTGSPSIALTQQQKQRVYQAMHTAKERNEERLSLNRFIKFGYEYSQGFKMDIPLNPIVIMKMVHPHFGYLNNLPTAPEYKYTHDQLVRFIEQFAAASHVREKGYTLHSSEIVSFIFWKVITKNKASVTLQQFFDLMKIFKFNLTEQNYRENLSFSVQRDQITKQQVRFDVFRQIFIDRDL